MSTNTIDTEKTPDTSTPQPQAKGRRTAAKKTKPAKKARQPKKAAGKPPADRANKKAEVIAMMKRAKGATLPEIMKATGLAAAHSAWLRQHPGQQGRAEHRVVQERRWRAQLQDSQVSSAFHTPPPWILVLGGVHT